MKTMKIGDPSDKLDAQADGAFGGKPVNRRAGYGDRLEMVLRFAKKGACLSAGEGQLIVEHYEDEIVRLREQLTYQTIKLTAEHQRARDILAALRDPSNEIVDVVAAVAWCDWRDILSAYAAKAIIRAALAAAEKEVEGE